jgi:hypothetical protein
LTINFNQLQQNIVAKFHEEWKGRIDPWQLRKKQRRKALRNTKQLQQATGNDKGDAMSVPKVFGGELFR